MSSHESGRLPSRQSNSQPVEFGCSWKAALQPGDIIQSAARPPSVKLLQPENHTEHARGCAVYLANALGLSFSQRHGCNPQRGKAICYQNPNQHSQGGRESEKMRTPLPLPPPTSPRAAAEPRSLLTMAGPKDRLGLMEQPST